MNIGFELGLYGACLLVSLGAIANGEALMGSAILAFGGGVAVLAHIKVTPLGMGLIGLAVVLAAIVLLPLAISEYRSAE